MCIIAEMTDSLQKLTWKLDLNFELKWKHVYSQKDCCFTLRR